MTLALGSVASGVWSAGQTVTVPITTTATSGVLVATCPFNVNSGTVAATSVVVTSPTLGTWARREGLVGTGNSSQGLWEFTAQFSSKLTNEVVTFTMNASFVPNYGLGVVFEIEGAATSSYFDPNLPSPITGIVAGTADPLSITTTNANDFIYGIFRQENNASPTPATGWTAIYDAANEYFLVEYKIVSATQSALSVTDTATSGDANGGIADAIIAAAGGPSCPRTLLTMGVGCGIAAAENIRQNRILTRRDFVPGLILPPGFFKRTRH